MCPRPFPISHCHHIDKRAGSVVLDADRAGLVFWLGVRPSARHGMGENGDGCWGFGHCPTE